MDELNIRFEKLGSKPEHYAPGYPFKPLGGNFTLLSDETAADVFARARRILGGCWTATGPYEVPSLDAKGEPAWARSGRVELALRLYDQGKLLRCSALGALSLAWALLHDGEFPSEEVLEELLLYLVPQEALEFEREEIRSLYCRAAKVGYKPSRANERDYMCPMQLAGHWNHRVGKRAVIVAFRDAEARLRGWLGTEEGGNDA